MKKPTTNRKSPPVSKLSGDIVLTATDIRDLGLEEAPDDMGPSVEEILVERAGRQNHG